MSRSFQKARTASSSSGNPARVETSWNMDANSSGSLAEELAEDVEHRDGDHRREVHAEPGGDHAPQRAQDGFRDVDQESHEQPVVIADEPGDGGPDEDGKDEEIDQDLGKGVQEIDGVLHWRKFSAVRRARGPIVTWWRLLPRRSHSRPSSPSRAPAAEPRVADSSRRGASATAGRPTGPLPGRAPSGPPSSTRAAADARRPGRRRQRPPRPPARPPSSVALGRR